MPLAMSRRPAPEMLLEKWAMPVRPMLSAGFVVLLMTMLAVPSEPVTPLLPTRTWVLAAMVTVPVSPESFWT